MRYATRHFQAGLVLALVILLILALRWAWSAPAAEPPAAGPVGRYQIIATRAFSLGLQNGQPAGEERALTIRWDTTTGQSWQLLKLNINGQTRDTWQPIAEPAAASSK